MEKHRLIWLDSARGLAALGVVLWHWQHMFAVYRPLPELMDRGILPFYAVLFPFYEQGMVGVDVFFLLSGFIFFWGQKAAIENRSLHAREFFWRRFSRLYPLHIVTLLLVVALQATFTGLMGHPFIYTSNDTPHFLAQLVFAQNWFTTISTFNGPTWSVSVEVLLYAAFFALARRGALRKPWVAPLLVLVGVALFHLEAQISRGLAGFFMGGALWWAWSQPRARGRGVFYAVLAYVALGWGIVLAHLQTGFLDPPGGMLLDLVPVFRGHEAFILNRAYFWLADVALLAPTVLALALAEIHAPVRSTWLSRLGDISYSSYLLHFPLQIVVAIGMVSLGVSSVATSGAALLCFFAVLIAASWTTYVGFERPSQDWLRRRSPWRNSARPRGEVDQVPVSASPGTNLRAPPPAAPGRASAGSSPAGE